MSGRQKLDDGENMKNLTLVRHALEKELGSDKVSRIRSSNFALDVLLATVPPIIGWTTTVTMWNFPISSPIYSVAAFVAGWAMMTCGLCWHDVVGHRGAFGKWLSWIVGLWITSCLPVVCTAMNTTWLARHRIHHKHTFEQKDPELFRNDLNGPLYRIISMFGVFRAIMRKRIYRKYNQQMDVEKEYPGSLGKEYAYKIAIENKLIKVHNLVWFALLIYNPAATLRTIVGSVGFYGIFDTLRYILEHGEQDLDNPFWQSTFYQTGWLTQIASTWCGGDCHAVHHIWHDVPIYRLREAVALITPIMIREGVQVRTSFLELVKAYLISGEAHANRWFQDSRSKAKAG